MSELTIKTKGTAIELSDARIITAKAGGFIGWMSVKVGDMSIDIDFDTPEEMINFCEKHNFSYKDERIENTTDKRNAN